jgi:hypothetical protein
MLKNVQIHFIFNFQFFWGENLQLKKKLVIIVILSGFRVEL